MMVTSHKKIFVFQNEGWQGGEEIESHRDGNDLSRVTNQICIAGNRTQGPASALVWMEGVLLTSVNEGPSLRY